MVLQSPQSELSFKGLPAGDVLAGGGALVVVHGVGGASFIFGPGFSSLVVPFPLEANFYLAVVDEVSQG